MKIMMTWHTHAVMTPAGTMGGTLRYGAEVHVESPAPLPYVPPGAEPDQHRIFIGAGNTFREAVAQVLYCMRAMGEPLPERFADLGMYWRSSTN